MTPDPLPPSPDAPPKLGTPSTIATVFAALQPLGAPLVCLMFLFVLGHGRGLMMMIEEAGWSAWLVLAALFFASLACTVLVVLAARGMRVPSAIAVFLVGTPWLFGVAGMRLGMHTAAGAVAHADPSSRATMMARGLSEAINARILGAWSTASLACAMAIGLAIAAAGQRAPNRKWAFAGVGAVLALPVLGAVGYGIFGHVGMGADSLLMAACFFAVLIALPLAAGAPGADPPNARAASLAAAVPPLLLLAWVAAAATATSDMTRQVFGAIANADSGSRLQMLAQGLSEAHIGTTVGWIGAVPLALACAAVAGWAFTRAKPSTGRLVGGAAVAALVLLVLGADAFGRGAVDAEVRETVRSPWADVAGFTPMRLADTDRHFDENEDLFVLGPDGVALRATRVPAAELEGVGGQARATHLVSDSIAHPGGEQAEGDERMPEWLQDGGSHERALDEPAISVAIDARTRAPVIRAFLRAAEAGGAHSIVLIGTGSAADESASTEIAQESPIFAALVASVSRVRVVLEPGMRPGAADESRTLFHATIGAATSGAISPRPGSDAEPIQYSDELPEHDYHYEDDNGIRDPNELMVYLALADDATGAGLGAAASWATQHRREATLVLGAIPGNPELRMDGPGLGLVGTGNGGPGEGTIGLGNLGTIGLGNLGTIGHGTSWGSVAGSDSATPHIRSGEADVRGSLSREVIRRVIQRHINEVRYCYEEELASHPALAGRVIVSFIISADGAVQSSSVSSSTLGDPTAETCIAAAVRRWTFPAPEGGGIVGVNYPFVLETTAPGDAPPSGLGTLGS